MLAVVIDFPRADKASGTTLVVCLLLLVPLLLLGVGTMESAVLGERMAANIEDRARAFDAAETALEAGEAWLRSQAGERAFWGRIYRIVGCGGTCPAPMSSGGKAMELPSEM
jgi:Tfp pilus assembly protein PilX